MSAKANTRLNERGMVSDGGKESGFAAYVHIWKKNVKNSTDRKLMRRNSTEALSSNLPKLE